MRYDYPSAKDVAGKELREVLASTEALLAALGSEGGDTVQELRERLTTTIADVRKQMGPSVMSTARDTIARVRDTAGDLDDFVQDRPWSALAIGAGVGLLIGFLLRQSD